MILKFIYHGQEISIINKSHECLDKKANLVKKSLLNKDIKNNNTFFKQSWQAIQKNK